MATGKVTGTVKDVFTGSAVQGAKVDTLSGSIIVDTQTTDSSGIFLTGDLTLGSYRIVITKIPYQQESLEVIVCESLITIMDTYLHPLNLYGQTSNGTYQPLTTNSMNALTLSSLTESACRNGNLYGAATGAQTMAASDFFAIELSNPSGSGRTVHIGRLLGGATIASVIDLIKNGTFSSGTTVTTTKWNYGYADDSSTTVKWLAQATDPTVGGILQTSIIQTGEPLICEINGQIIIPPNNTMVVRTSNPSSTSSNQIAATIIWWEENV